MYIPLWCVWWRQTHDEGKYCEVLCCVGWCDSSIFSRMRSTRKRHNVCDGNVFEMHELLHSADMAYIHEWDSVCLANQRAKCHERFEISCVRSSVAKHIYNMWDLSLGWYYVLRSYLIDSVNRRDSIGRKWTRHGRCIRFEYETHLHRAICDIKPHGHDNCLWNIAKAVSQRRHVVRRVVICLWCKQFKGLFFMNGVNANSSTYHTNMHVAF